MRSLFALVVGFFVAGFGAFVVTHLVHLGIWISERFGGTAVWMFWGFAVVLPACCAFFFLAVGLAAFVGGWV